MATIKFCKIHPLACTPEYAHKGSDSGLDLYAVADSEIKPMSVGLVPTGICMEIPVGYEGQVRSRSSLALKGIIVANSPGTIDSGYRGEIQVILLNLSQDSFLISPKMRIAQLVITQISVADLLLVDSLGESSRGKSGFGSTGI